MTNELSLKEMNQIAQDIVVRNDAPYASEEPDTMVFVRGTPQDSRYTDGYYTSVRTGGEGMATADELLAAMYGVYGTQPSLEPSALSTLLRHARARFTEHDLAIDTPIIGFRTNKLSGETDELGVIAGGLQCWLRRTPTMFTPGQTIAQKEVSPNSDEKRSFNPKTKGFNTYVGSIVVPVSVKTAEKSVYAIVARLSRASHLKQEHTTTLPGNSLKVGKEAIEYLRSRQLV